MHVPEIEKEREKLPVCFNTFKLFSQKFSKLPLMFNVISPGLAPQFLFDKSWNFMEFLELAAAGCPGTVPWRTKSWSCFSIELPPPGQTMVIWMEHHSFFFLNITSPVLGSTQLHPAAVFTWKGAHRITAPHLSSFCSHRSPRWPLDAGHQKCCQWPCPAGAWLSWFRWRSPVAKTLAKKYWQTVD